MLVGGGEAGESVLQQSSTTPVLSARFAGISDCKVEGGVLYEGPLLEVHDS